MLTTNSYMCRFPTHGAREDRHCVWTLAPDGLEDTRCARTDAWLCHRQTDSEQISGNQLALNQGTLYPALLKLEHTGWVTTKWVNRRAADA